MYMRMYVYVQMFVCVGLIDGCLVVGRPKVKTNYNSFSPPNIGIGSPCIHPGCFLFLSFFLSSFISSSRPLRLKLSSIPNINRRVVEMCNNEEVVDDHHHVTRSKYYAVPSP